MSRIWLWLISVTFRLIQESAPSTNACAFAKCTVLI